MRVTAPAVLLTLLLALPSPPVLADEVGAQAADAQGVRTIVLTNECVELSVVCREGGLAADSLAGRGQWLSLHGGEALRIASDADFAVELMWTGWRAPGRVDNADNDIVLGKGDFAFVDHEFADLPGGAKRCDLFFKGADNQLELRLSYTLAPGDFFARRKVAIRDPEERGHFLMLLAPLAARVEHGMEVIKAGGFGQPVVLENDKGGAFFGLEYPAATNTYEVGEGTGKAISCSQEMGVRIGPDWVESEWAVYGLAPEARARHWFWKYVDRIRVAPLRPYLLYNSWYDVRSPEYTERPEDVMNEANVLRIVGDFKREMLEERGLKLDAFVLDDGWDVYESDWVLRPDEFPRGLKPIAAALAEMGTDLGIWFGPIGGYSFREKRVGWMREHGYETVGDQLCLAGDIYKELFKRRVVGFVRDEGVRYYKWDGIQFSCSEPGHGHPVGVYSRRAVMESVIELCRAVRGESPGMFLNITSGTWLSPWWLKHANMIWMQGNDYGYADVPSISRRDAAITYRDFVLYEDFRKHDLWFPLANLMTHGIIKGHLQKLGGEDEPLDKFTDNALLYFARGVSMWELYISPNLLSDGEWDALAGSIRWAKDRFDLLRNTEMIGGDPGGRQAYGYVHFAGKRGIVAARNPFIEPRTLRVELDPKLGIDPDAQGLVVERVYPTCRIRPELFRAGDAIEIALQGYETAVFEIYPLEEATEPLLAGATCERVEAGAEYALSVFEVAGGARLLNPEAVEWVEVDGRRFSPADFELPEKALAAPVDNLQIGRAGEGPKPSFTVSFELGEEAADAVLAVLLEPAEKAEEGEETKLEVVLDGAACEPRVERQQGGWSWHLVDLSPGHHEAVFTIGGQHESVPSEGKVSAWVISDVKHPATRVVLKLRRAPRERPMPPRPRPDGLFRVTTRIVMADF